MRVTVYELDSIYKSFEAETKYMIYVIMEFAYGFANYFNVALAESLFYVDLKIRLGNPGSKPLRAYSLLGRHMGNCLGRRAHSGARGGSNESLAKN